VLDYEFGDQRVLKRGRRRKKVATVTASAIARLFKVEMEQRSAYARNISSRRFNAARDRRAVRSRIPALADKLNLGITNCGIVVTVHLIAPDLFEGMFADMTAYSVATCSYSRVRVRIIKRTVTVISQ
jgi:hypothetical protein